MNTSSYFHAYCHRDNPDEHVVFDDPDRFEAHMSSHDHRKAREFKPLKPWRPPPRRAYEPRADAPGQPITYAEVIGGYWTGPRWGEGEWVPTERHVRCGVIWSTGPLYGSLWIVPDDAPATFVMVRKPRLRKYPMIRGVDWELAPDYGPDWQRETRTRVEHLRHAGHLYATVRRYRSVEITTWHAEENCPNAASDDRADRPAIYAITAIRYLLSRSGNTGDLCRRCVWLLDDVGNPIREEVTS